MTVTSWIRTFLVKPMILLEAVLLETRCISYSTMPRKNLDTYTNMLQLRDNLNDPLHYNTFHHLSVLQCISLFIKMCLVRANICTKIYFTIYLYNNLCLHKHVLSGKLIKMYQNYFKMVNKKQSFTYRNLIIVPSDYFYTY